MIISMEASWVGRDDIYPRVWQVKLNKEQALSLLSEIQSELKKLDEGTIDE